MSPDAHDHQVFDDPLQVIVCPNHLIVLSSLPPSDVRGMGESGIPLLP